MPKLDLIRTKAFQFLVFSCLLIGVGLAVAVDSDNDGMSDLYENFFKLNATNATDAVQNHDTDTLLNQQEALLWTDPRASDTDADGLDDGMDNNPLSRAVIMWGNPDFTSGDEYSYTGPDWLFGAGRSGGIWLDEGGWQVESNAPGVLYIDIDRTRVTNNLMLNLLHVNAANSLVYLDLGAPNGTMLAVNLYGDLTTDDGAQVLSRYILPLADYPTASRIIIEAEADAVPYTIWASTLYEDADADGLDADQEIQFGTSDTNPDSDTDDLTDYIETMVEGTDPLDPDTDHDGFADGVELNELKTSPNVPMQQEGGIAGTLQVERWNGIEGDTTAALKAGEYFGVSPDAVLLVTSAEYAPEGLDAGENYGIRMRGTITAPADGTYTFQLTGDCAAEVWLSDTASPYGRKRLLDLSGWTDFRDLSDGDVPSATVELSAGQTCYVEILLQEDIIFEHVSLWWTLPGETNPEIIGSEYLHSYVQPADDSDMDGLPDALDPNPLDGIGGGLRDTDGDGFSDHEEINLMGTSPIVSMWKDGVAGVLQVERWNNIKGSLLVDLKANARFGGASEASLLITSTEYAPQGLDAGENYGIRMRGTITAPSDGTYTFQLTGDCDAEVWLSDTASPYGRKRLLDLSKWTDFQDLSDANAPSVTVELSAGQICYVEILLKEDVYFEHVSLWWTLPGETKPEIIGSQYLHSYVQPDDDQDADGLPDAWELANGLNPSNGIGGGYKDTDGDGYSDFIEFSAGLDPQAADADADGLSDGDEVFITRTDPDSTDTDTDGVPDLRTVLSIPGADFIDYFDAHITATWSTDAVSAVVSKPYANPWVVYNLSVADAGIYRIAIDAAKQSIYPVRLVAEIDGIQIDELSMNDSSDLPTYTFIAPWLCKGDHTLKLTVRGFFWEAEPFNIHSIKLGAIDGGDADDDGLQDWMDGDMDTDGDGLADLDEVALHNSDPLNSDSDGDGLADGAELTQGTDINNPDSDEDGVLDGTEVNETLTNPLVAEFDGTVVNLLTLDGSATNSATGNWTTNQSTIQAACRRGELEYLFTLPIQDIVRVEVEATHLRDNSSSQIEDVSALDFYVDDIYIGSRELVSVGGVVTNVQAFLPVLSEGEHTLTVFWENLDLRLALQVNQIRFQQLGGPDADEDGTKDWVQTSLDAMTGIDAPVPQASGLPCIQSVVSPICLEGSARYPELATVATLHAPCPMLHRGAGSRWYANVPINEDGLTDMDVSFQNGAMTRTVQAEWIPYNIMKYNGAELVVRKGDQIKFVALPEEMTGGQFELEFEVMTEGETVRSPNTEPLIYSFPEAGTFTVNGEYSHGNDIATASVRVRVIDWTFPEESPACLLDTERLWALTNVPNGVVFEADPSVELSISNAELTGGLPILRDVTLSLTATEANGEHVIVSRLYPGGPLLAVTKLHPFWLKGSADNYMSVVERYEDSELWETTAVAKHLPADVDVLIDVFAGGITLDDYTIERWLTADDFDETGSYTIRLFHPNDRDGSTCFRTEVYQDEQKIGTP